MSSPPLQILILEDRLTDAELIVLELRRAGFTPEWRRVDNREDYLAHLHPGLDVILADYTLPQFDAPSALALLQQCDLDIPFIVVTGSISEEAAVACIKQGASDYLIKDRLKRLGPAVEHALHEKRLRDEKRHAEEALRQSEEYFRSLIEHTSDIIAVLDAEGDIRYMSPAIERVLGYQPHTLIGQNAFTFVHPSDASHIFNTFSRVIQFPGMTQSIEFRFRHSNASWRTLEGVGKFFFGESEGVSVILNCRDITERKQHEREQAAIVSFSAALRTASNRTAMLPIVLDQVRALLQADGAALALCDLDTDEIVIELANGSCAAYTGTRLAPGDDIVSKVIGTGQRYMRDRAHGDSGSTRCDKCDGPPIVACVPLTPQDRTIGAIYISRNTAISDAELRLLTAISDLTANAIHRATLHEQTQRRAHRLAALHAIDMAITASLDLRLTLNVVLDQVTAQLGVHAADVLLLNPHFQMLEYAAGRGFRTAGISQSRLRLGEGHAGRAAYERRIAYVTNIPQNIHTFAHASLIAGEDFIAYYTAPLITKGQVKGVLELFHRAPLHADLEWLDFLEALATQTAIAIDNAELFEQIQRSNAELVVAYEATLEGWVKALDLRDKETEGHTQRVTEMTVRLARVLGMNDEDIAHVRRGALLHDIGKMAIPDGILLKPGTLNAAEWTVMRQHPVYAYDWLYSIAFLRPALDIPYCHHEKWDGTGYPRGLKGEEIPLAARIFTVVDVWDALRSDRPYRRGWAEEQVREHVASLAGTHLDPHIARIFLEYIANQNFSEVVQGSSEM